MEYRTSAVDAHRGPVNMLHDFYIPALKLANGYDRVAGYFRSSSLAAASQGFSAFVGRRGKMRLIVGADLDPADVRAIMAGDEARLADRLNEELSQPEEWPEGVKNGVTLLGWMVAHGYLEVKVAFRVEAGTRKPRPWHWSEDGYVHEKWLLMRDEFGHCMAAAGSLNESKTALVPNAENLVVFCNWHGGRDRQRVEKYARDFERLWNDENPYIRSMSLPEAVKARLICLSEGIKRPVEIDGSTAATPVPSVEPSSLERLRAAVIWDGPKLPAGRFVGLETAPIDPWPHQTMVVRRLIETWPYSYLLSDEVGLGKTIEAGLAFRSLYLSGIVRRILIAAPASLTKQWQREMATKMLMPFGLARSSPTMQHVYEFPKPMEVQARSLYDPDLVIVSTGLWSRRDRVKEVRSVPRFDIVLVDEAHAARRKNPTKGTKAHPEYGYLYQALRDYVKPASRSMWLATATPMQLDPVEVSDLLALTDRVGQFQFDPTLTSGYYDILARLVSRRSLTPSEWDFLRKAITSLKNLDPMLWEHIGRYVVDAPMKTVMTKWLGYGSSPGVHEQALLGRFVFAAAPLSRVMLRHTRRLLEIYRERGHLSQNLARRHIEPLVAVNFTPLEKQAYDDLEEYARGLSRRLARHGDGRTRNMLQFLLSFMRLRFASSLFAIQQTLRRRLKRVEASIDAYSRGTAESDELDVDTLAHRVYDEYEAEDDDEPVAAHLKDRTLDDLRWEKTRLERMLARLTDSPLERPSKIQALLKILEGREDRGSRRIAQTVVFTRFYDTLVDIVRHLTRAKPDIRLGTYSGQGAERLAPETGQLEEVGREKVKELFLRGEIDVLICTDAAAEGLNLQTADLLINFDLGWNPMKIEQRIGRIDRIGQRHAEIRVVNMCYVGSEEEEVYGRLWDRLQKVHRVVGSQQMSILPVTREEFEALADKKLSIDELTVRARKRLAAQQDRTAKMEMDPQDLYDVYTRVQADEAFTRAPVDRSSILRWLNGLSEKGLAGVGRRIVDGHEVFTVRGVDEIPETALLTVSPELYDRGLSEDNRSLHFASYGDPVFDALLDYMRRFELPPSIQRISVSLPGLPHAEMAAYAVLGRDSQGVRQLCLVKSWQDVEALERSGLSICDDEGLTDDDVKPLRTQLENMAMRELPHLATADWIFRENIASAKAQQVLNYCVIAELLDGRAGGTGTDVSVQALLRDVENAYAQRSATVVSGLPADMLRPLEEMLLFELTGPTVGRYAQVRVPPILLESALDAARVLESQEKKGKGTVRYETLARRLRQRASELSREIQHLQGRFSA